MLRLGIEVTEDNDTVKIKTIAVTSHLILLSGPQQMSNAAGCLASKKFWEMYAS